MKCFFKLTTAACLTLLIFGNTVAATPVVDITEYVKEDVVLPQHPRLLLLKGEEKALARQIGKDATWKEIHQVIMDEAEAILKLEPKARIMEGKRLLYVAKENLRRMFFLSYAYRMTSDKRFLKKGEEELLNIASYSDWNPSHFLDVAEMTMTMSIGYDWLYQGLSPQTRKAVEDAIIEKGIKASYDTRFNWFVDATNNWNQVCNAGITYGCLAVWDREPELARRTVNRALTTVHYPMAKYASEGNYPEGPGYWDYGTSFNVMMISAIEKVFHTDFGLSQMPGFLLSSKFILQMVTPALQWFSFSDNGRNFAYAGNDDKAWIPPYPDGDLDAKFFPGMFWFYAKTGDESVIFNQKQIYLRDRERSIRNNRLAPAALIWGSSSPFSTSDSSSEPKELNMVVNGDNPIVVMRSSWTDPEAAYLGVKLGYAGQSHGHMDTGEFIFEQGGVSWAVDLGPDHYHAVEAAGIDLWNLGQKSQRWEVTRYNNFHHNTLTFNKKLQNVMGAAEIGDFKVLDGKVTVDSDLSAVYAGQVESAKRTYSLVDGKSAVIEDEIVTGKLFTMLTWTVVTPAEVTKISGNEVRLEKNGKVLLVKVEGLEGIRWSAVPLEPSYSFESPNPGITLLTFDADLPLDSRSHVKVSFLPQ